MPLQSSCPHLEGPTHADYSRPEAEAASANFGRLRRGAAVHSRLKQPQLSRPALGIVSSEPVMTSLPPLCSGHLGKQ